MALSDELRRLASLVDRVEAGGIEVLEVERLDDGSTGADDDESMRATLEVRVSVDATESATETEHRPDQADGGSTDENGVSARGPAEPGGTSNPTDGGGRPATEDEPGKSDSDREPAETAVDDGEDDAVSCRDPDCPETFETAHGMKIHHTKTHVSEGDPPAYRDPARLREAYETCDTLAEIRDHLDADVTVTTIRRQLIANDIHEPGVDESEAPDTEDPDPGKAGPEETDVEAAGRADPDATGQAPEPAIEAPADVDVPTQAVTTDGAEFARRPVVGGETDDDAAAGDEMTRAVETADDGDLAGDVTVDTLADAVKEARTVYDVERALDVDRERTIELLREHDLLEIVHGRVADERERTALREEVDERVGGTTGSAD